MNAHDPFKTAKPVARKSVRRSPIHVDDLEVSDDPVPKKRNLGPGRYDQLFKSMKVGQCLKCVPEHTGALGNALRNWIKKNKKKDVAVKSVRHYPGCREKLGRVWLISKEKN